MTARETDDRTVALLGGLCFFLSTVEFMIPKPLPFLRLGIANLPVMLALDILPFPAWLLLVGIKILGQGIASGTLFSYVCVFSAASSLASGFVMLALRKLLGKRVSFVGLSAAGAFASNAAALAVARFWIFGEGAWYVAPPFIAVGLATGTLLGAFANAFASRSRWYAALRDGSAPLPSDLPPIDARARAGLLPANPAFRFGLGLPLIAALLFSDSIAAQAAIVAAGTALVLSDGARIRLAPTAVFTLGIVFFNLLVPFGKVLAEPAGFRLTEGALVSGIKKALSLEGMIFVSRWMLRPGLALPGRAGRILSSAFATLGTLSSRRERFNPRDPIASVDRIMLERD